MTLLNRLQSFLAFFQQPQAQQFENPSPSRFSSFKLTSRVKEALNEFDLTDSEIRDIEAQQEEFEKIILLLWENRLLLQDNVRLVIESNQKFNARNEVSFLAHLIQIFDVLIGKDIFGEVNLLSQKNLKLLLDPEHEWFLSIEAKKIFWNFFPSLVTMTQRIWNEHVVPPFSPKQFLKIKHFIDRKIEDYGMSITEEKCFSEVIREKSPDKFQGFFVESTQKNPQEILTTSDKITPII